MSDKTTDCEITMIDKENEIIEKTSPIGVPNQRNMAEAELEKFARNNETCQKFDVTTICDIDKSDQLLGLRCLSTVRER